jgi:hypothetical protein
MRRHRQGAAAARDHRDAMATLAAMLSLLLIGGILLLAAGAAGHAG